MGWEEKMNRLQSDLCYALAVGTCLSCWWYVIAVPTVHTDLDAMIFMFSCIFMFTMPSICAIAYNKNEGCEN